MREQSFDMLLANLERAIRNDERFCMNSHYRTFAVDSYERDAAGQLSLVELQRPLALFVHPHRQRVVLHQFTADESGDPVEGSRTVRWVASEDELNQHTNYGGV
jgi:hypothetical protein